MKDASIGNPHSGLVFSGSVTLEIMLALVVMTITFTALISVVFGNQTAASDIEMSDDALAKAQMSLAAVRASAEADFYALQSTTPVADGRYQTSLAVQLIDPMTKQVASTVTWSAHGRALGITLTTLVTNATALVSGDTCDPNPTGDWSHPQLLGSATIDAGNLATDVAVVNGTAYLAADASTTSAADLYVVDVRTAGASGSVLPILGFINTGPGIAAVAAGGHYVFAANTSRTGQLQIIDVADPAHPTLVKTVRLINVSGTGSQGVGNSIAYDYAAKRVYLGLTKTGSGPELAIFDVSAFLADATQDPVLVGSWDAGTSINRIAPHGTTIYVATPYPSSNPATDENLSILDVTDPAHVVRTGTFSYAGYATMSGQGLALSPQGTALYLGRGGGDLLHNPELFALDTANSAAPRVTRALTLGAAVHALVVRGSLVLMTTSDASRGFQIWDINASSTQPYATLAIGPNPSGMDCEGNLLYVTEQGESALQIIGPK